jgi:hemolysin activation/secretion protein
VDCNAVFLKLLLNFVGLWGAIAYILPLPTAVAQTQPNTPPPRENLPSPPFNPQPNPNEDRFLQPAPTPLPTTPEQEKPVLPTPTPTPTPETPPVRFKVQKIQVTGSTVLSADEINRLIQPLEGREVTLDELRAVADAITQLYIDRGFITSRAVLPDQTIADGIVQIRIIEGSIERIEIEGNRRVNAGYVRSRVQLGAGMPLNTAKLEDQLRLLRINPLFDNVEASLRAGTELGRSILIVRVQEANPFKPTLSVDNFSPPSVGSERLGMGLIYRNLTGLGDEVAASYYRSTTGGSNALDFAYRIPLNAKDGTLQIRVAPNWFKVTDPDFDELDINGDSQLYEASFRQPLIRSTREELALSVGFTFQDGQTFIGDLPTPFSLGPDKDGRSRTSVFKFGQDYLRRDATGAIAVRSQFSFGTGLLDATNNSGDVPDGQFISWLGQIQRVQRLSNSNLLIVQADVQLTPNGLLPSQQFVIGGGQSLRGYRQNVRAGDNGFRFSMENRMTLQRDANGLATFQVAPFVDLGSVWNVSSNPNSSPDQRFLAGIGLGLLWQPLPNVNLRLDYGYPLIDLKDRGENAQDSGFYFQILYQP